MCSHQRWRDGEEGDQGRRRSHGGSGAGLGYCCTTHKERVGRCCGRNREWCSPFIQGGGAGGRAQRQWCAPAAPSMVVAR
jgi:hypothetical protein